LELSFKYGLGHIGSCLSCVEILWEIYTNYPDDIVILSNGHAGVALYCALEYFFGIEAEQLLVKHGIHPRYDPDNKIYCTTGSLGCGLPVAIGYALAGKSTHCIISDGECTEGSIWESLAFIKQHNVPIKVYVNMNGLAAYQTIDKDYLTERLIAFYPEIKIYQTSNYPFPNTVTAHYVTIKSEEELAIYEKNLCQTSVGRNEKQQ
jgi:transketolase N-terminal domain/subunit